MLYKFWYPTKVVIINQSPDILLQLKTFGGKSKQIQRVNQRWRDVVVKYKS